MNEARMKTNGMLIALFFMQYTILMPVMQFVNSTLVVAVFSLGIVFYYLLKNGSFIGSAALVFFCVALLLVFLFKVAILQANLTSILFLFMLILPSIVMFAFPFSFDACVHSLIQLARLGFFLVFFIPIVFEFNYMRFGYGILPIVILMYISVFYRKNGFISTIGRNYSKLDLSILVISFAEMLFFGARGCLVALVIFFIMDRLIINKSHAISNLIICVVVLVTVLNLSSLIDLADKITQLFGIDSYAVKKYKMQLAGGFESAASGRVRIYNNALEKIRLSPWTGGVVDLDEGGGKYAHNLFLQTGEDLGIIAMIVLLCFVVFAIFVIAEKKGTYEEKIVLMILFSTSIGRLMFSSTIWRRPEFWMLVALIITLKRNRYCEEEILQKTG